MPGQILSLKSIHRGWLSLDLATIQADDGAVEERSSRGREHRLGDLHVERRPVAGEPVAEGVRAARLGGRVRGELGIGEQRGQGGAVVRPQGDDRHPRVQMRRRDLTLAA